MARNERVKLPGPTLGNTDLVLLLVCIYFLITFIIII